MRASWAEYYSTINELKAHADFAILGVVSAVSPASMPPDAPIYTIVSVEVSRELWRREKFASVPSSFAVEQTGGIAQNVVYEVEDDPLFAVGEQVVLFVREYAAGKYKIVGGPTARFAVFGSAVRAIAPQAIALPPGTVVDDLLR